MITGGMAPFVNSKSALVNRKNAEAVKQQKLRGAKVGLDGELVADPCFVHALREAYQGAPNLILTIKRASHNGWHFLRFRRTKRS